jgi:hypothetical protein
MTMKTQTMLWLATAVLTVGPARAADTRTDQFEIVEGVSGVDPQTGFVTIRGEVKNRSGQPVESCQVMVELFDPAGKPIDVTGFLAEAKKEARVDPRDSVLTERHFIPAGESSVFEYLRDPKKLGGAKYGSHKLSANAWKSTAPQPKVAVEGFKSAKGEFGTYTVSGTLRNVGSVPCRSPKAVLGLFTAEGKVAHATYEQPDEMFQKQLAPGATVRFSSTTVHGPEGVAIKDVKAWGDCAEPE